jgi:hypothetical protein
MSQAVSTPCINTDSTTLSFTSQGEVQRMTAFFMGAPFSVVILTITVHVSAAVTLAVHR